MMTSERAEEIDRVLLDSLRDGPRYLDMGHSPVEAIERCFALADAGKVHIQSGWVYAVPGERKVSNETTPERTP